ncbi:MAG: hypothetical protein DRI95_08990 [Bacteroidetes bacterium]|nr:MAG: hypothetical protein DRI95_08990 [Bacteroidota bacterium]
MSNLIYMLLTVFVTFSSYEGQFDVYETNFHPVHVSFTNIEFIEEKKEFQILFKIFADDFDLILKKKYDVYLNLENGKKPNGYEKIVTKYILEHFKIVIDNKNLTASKLRFLNLEFKEKAVWLHYIYKFKGQSDHFELWNSLMTDLYLDQTNLLIFNYYSFQKAIRFTNDKTKEVLSVK